MAGDRPAFHPGKEEAEKWISRQARRLLKTPRYSGFSFKQRYVIATITWEQKHRINLARLIGKDANNRPVVERLDQGHLRRWAIKKDGHPTDYVQPLELWVPENDNINRTITFNKEEVGEVLSKLAALSDYAADELYTKIMRAWGSRIERQFITLSKLTTREISLLRMVGCDVAGLGVVSSRYIAKYVNKDLKKEVVVKTKEEPRPERRFRVPGEGKPKFALVKVQRTDGQPYTPTQQPEEGEATVATKTKKKGSAKSKKSNRKKRAAAESDDEDELITEDDLEDLDDLDDIEAEEPDDEEDEDEEEDDEDEEEEAPRARKRKRSTKKGKAKRTRSRKRKADPDDEDVEDDDDDEEEETPRKRQRKGAKKGGKKSGKKGGGVAGRSTAELTGGVGTAELAKAAGVDGRTVRLFLRKNKVKKNEEHGRYVWPSEKNKEFKSLVKKIQADQEDED